MWVVAVIWITIRCLSLIAIIVVPHAATTGPEFPRLSIPILYSSSSDIVLNACLSVPISFTCEFGEEHQNAIAEGFAYILVNDQPIAQSYRGWPNITLSVTYSATELVPTHPLSNFTCGTRVPLASEYEVWTSRSNVIKIKFHQCSQQQRRTHRLMAGKSIKMICPFNYPRGFFEWDLDGFPLNRLSSADADKYRLNANGSSITVNNLTREDSGVYRCFPKPFPWSLGYLNVISHDLTVLSRDEVFPKKLQLAEANGTSLLIAWTPVEVENRVGIKRHVINHGEPFVICYASLTDEIVKNLTVPSASDGEVEIIDLTPGNIYAVQSIGKSEQCFEHQDDRMEFFSTLSLGERWVTHVALTRLVNREGVRALDIVWGNQATMYCSGNLENLKCKNFSFAWYQGHIRIASSPNGRRRIDSKSGALIFDKVYAFDGLVYTCSIRFHGGNSSVGLIKGEHATEQFIFPVQTDTRSSYVNFNTLYTFECSNSTENSITIQWQGPTTIDVRRVPTWRRRTSVGGKHRVENGSRPIEPKNPVGSTFRIVYWEMEGMGSEEAANVLETNATLKDNGIVLENLNSDALYTISVSESAVANMESVLECWTDPIHDTL